MNLILEGCHYFYFILIFIFLIYYLSYIQIKIIKGFLKNMQNLADLGTFNVDVYNNHTQKNSHYYIKLLGIRFFLW